MQPDDTILFSKRACWMNSAFITGFSLLVGAVCLLCLSLSVWLSLFMTMVSVYILGWLFAAFSSRVMVTRLKIRYPGQADKIENCHCPFSRLFPIMEEEELAPFVCDDPQAGQLLKEYRTVYMFARAWVYWPILMLFPYVLLWGILSGLL